MPASRFRFQGQNGHCPVVNAPLAACVVPELLIAVEARGS